MNLPTYIRIKIVQEVRRAVLTLASALELWITAMKQTAIAMGEDDDTRGGE